MGFPAQFIGWIGSCLRSVMFSIALNGGLVGYFEGRKGLRQGDPLSPSLFVLIMEVLHCLFMRAAGSGMIAYHPKCARLFYSLSGLQLNPEKTEVFYSTTVPKSTREQITQEMGFKEGSLPVRYLGIPLISGKLRAQDCDILVSKITARITGWRVKTLSYAGRLQLVQAVLSTMSSYWMSIILLPKSVIKAVEKLCSDFLWKVTDGERKRARVAWKFVALPKEEGGLGIHDFESWNYACVLRHVWSILLQAGSLWIAWIMEYRLKRKTIWSCTAAPYHSWAWRRILKARDKATQHISIDDRGEPLWQGQEMGRYSVAKVWDAIRLRQTVVNWFELIWAGPCIPKHCFIAWLVVNNRLVTNTVIATWGLSVDISCLLCSTGIDELNHLMYGCRFGAEIRRRCYGSEVVAAANWVDYLTESSLAFKMNTMAGKTGRLFWRAIVSEIWYERCRRRAGEVNSTPTEIAGRICRDVHWLMR
ncbi:Putative ribonuclease H protein At1g65750 [Linum grandiflorum]